MLQNNSLVGSVFERRPVSKATPPKASSSGSTGFPSVQHRSKSAFSRNREEQRKVKPIEPPHVLSSSSSRMDADPPAEPEDWREQISRENEQRISGMTDEQIEEEKREILERFGTGIHDVLKRARQKRQQQIGKDSTRRNVIVPVDVEADKGDSLPEVPITHSESVMRTKSPERASRPPSAMSNTVTRPSSRLDRKIRFAELGPDDVHVYESAPSSPSKRVLALPPPTGDGSETSLGMWHGNLPATVNHLPPNSPSEDAQKDDTKAADVGSVEYIRRRYFPNAPANDPNLAWMQLAPSAELDTSSSPLRFDLHGNPISKDLSTTLPTHLGLHHHAEGEHAGYTLDDIFLLARSTVPAQRSAMLSVLAQIASKLAKAKKGNIVGMEEILGKEEELRKRIVAAGIAAMSDRGSVGARAIEVIWECIIGFDEDLSDIEGVDLEADDSVINSLSLEFFLPHVAQIFLQGGVVPETLTQLLSIVHRLAQQNCKFSSAIIETPRLIPSVLQTFLLTSIPPVDGEPLPEPAALQLLITLAMSSRSNAKAIEEVTDPLLRFITFIPSTSPYTEALSTSLLVMTLRLYTVLASYGFYSHIATTAMEQFSRLGQYIVSEACTSRSLRGTWASLVQEWTICAIDPHKTAPDHDILWSQITGWGWHEDVMQLQANLGPEEKDWILWTGTWNAQASWLEGCQINAMKGGEAERVAFITSAKSGFESGVQGTVLVEATEAFSATLTKLSTVNAGFSLQNIRELAGYAGLIASAIRLWLACIPPHTEGPLPSPPFLLPFPRISRLCANLMIHPLWALLSTESSSYGYVFCRPLTTLLVSYLKLSRRLPDISQDMWMAQAFSILLRLMPGDETFAALTTENLINLPSPKWSSEKNLNVAPIVWEKGGLSILNPFLQNTIQPNKESNIAPLIASPESIRSSTTQRLPSPSKLRNFGLPLYRDWTLTPLNHLLRSGDSAVLKELPISWDSSEAELTRATLFFSRIAQQTLRAFSLNDFVLTREQAIFGCMKVFMLEHDQPHNDSTEEVFRDSIVGSQMEDLLKSYTFSNATDSVVQLPGNPVIPQPESESIEKVAVRFLGPSVPFFQFYTDFVALYDAISFSDPLFARLLLPPTSMNYPIDYRKHLWGDFKHVLRTIRTPVDQILSANVREYLYPIESDPQMIYAYLRGLVSGSVQQFERLVALHHVASNIWPDLRDEESHDEDRASKLLKVVIDQGGGDMVKEIAQYHQSRNGPLLLPPACFSSWVEKEARMECVTRWGGKLLSEKMANLFNQ